MFTKRLCVCAALPALFVAVPAGGQGDANAWDTVLAAAGLARATCRFDPLDAALYGGGEFRLPYFDALHQDPLRIPYHARVVRETVARSAGSLAPLVTFAGIRIGEGTRLDLMGDPLKAEAEAAAKPGALAAVVMEMLKVGGKPLPRAQAAQITRSLAGVPAETQKLAALLLSTEVRALRWRTKALAGLPKPVLGRAFAAITAPADNEDDLAQDEAMEEVQRRIDLKHLLVGAELLSYGLDKAAAAPEQPAVRFACDVDTPLGRIAVHGSQDDTYEPRAYLLILDTGGADTYRAGGGNTSASHGASIIVDLAGNDRYASAPAMDATPLAQLPARKGRRAPAFGGGVLGYGMVLDRAGADLYRSAGCTQGFGAFGTGALLDLSGDDHYDCHTLGQGAARFGVGVLADRVGADDYKCFTTSQGFGETKGFGLLADMGADKDAYEANDTVIDFPSPQSAQHNATLAQGMGYGRRADYTDGHSLSGGVGVLADDGGANSYACGIFGQGVGYWYGVGMLLSGVGNDTYTGAWYVQGSEAHFAVGVLDDAGGNDTYKATMNMAQGAGHDFGIGFLLDRGGNDRYEAPNLSLGGGNANGIGLFWDASGDDTYVVAPSVTLGSGTKDATVKGTLRERAITLGLFLDTGGRDTYPAAIPGARDNARWSMQDAPLPAIRGAGLDVDAPSTPEP